MCIQSQFFHNQLRTYQVTLFSYDSVVRRKDVWSIPAKEDAGKGGKQQPKHS